MSTGRPSSRLRDRVWVRVLLPDAIVLIAAPVIEYFTWNHLNTFKDRGYIIGLSLVGLFTFWGIWSYERTVRNQSGSVAMRDAIAATVILLYLVMLSWALFFGSTPGSLNPITAELLQSFTSVTSIVVGFYFGSVTISQFAGRRNNAPVTASNAKSIGATDSTPPDG